MNQPQFRPDFSDYLVHFTSDRPPLFEKDNPRPVKLIGRKSAKEKLISILKEKKIFSSVLPWVNRLAVCFTECPWASLIEHANQYSHYGIGFKKARVFAAGGGPVYYVRADHFKQQWWDNRSKVLMTPFWPDYRSIEQRDPQFLKGKTVDFSHEREWRVPHDFRFEYNQVEFVVVSSYEDVAQFPKELKNAIGRENFLMTDVYKQIERLWPVHNIR